jgi:hypothetical protein
MSFRIPRPLIAPPAKRYYAARTVKPDGVGPKSKAMKRFDKAKCHLSDKKLVEGDTEFNRDQPARFKNMFKDLPAYDKWFNMETIDMGEQAAKRLALGRPMSKKKLSLLTEVTARRLLNMEYLEQFGDMTVPLEIRTQDTFGRQTFERFEGPFSMLLQHISEAKKGQSQDEYSRLYLAQHSLLDLPEALRNDLPTPDLIKKIGQGDVYASSLWMGGTNTVTPLHRDPNPNLFVQLAGKKLIRMFRPDVGKQLYEQALASIGKSPGMPNLRGEEMMKGAEMKALEHAVWKEDTTLDPHTKGIEVELKKGGGVYIPLGWWHAVRGSGAAPNVSVSRSAYTAR